MNRFRAVVQRANRSWILSSLLPSPQMKEAVTKALENAKKMKEEAKSNEEKVRTIAGALEYIHVGGFGRFASSVLAIARSVAFILTPLPSPPSTDRGNQGGRRGEEAAKGGWRLQVLAGSPLGEPAE